MCVKSHYSKLIVCVCVCVRACGCCCVYVKSTGGVFFYFIILFDLIVFSLILYLFCCENCVWLLLSLMVNSLITNKGYHLWGGLLFSFVLFACHVGCGFGYLFIYLFLLSEGNFILLYLFVGKCEFLRVLFVLSLLKNKMLSFFLPKC